MAPWPFLPRHFSHFRHAKDNGEYYGQSDKMKTTIFRNLEKFLWGKAHNFAGQVNIYLQNHPWDAKDQKLKKMM
jgi:hypothetical protein